MKQYIKSFFTPIFVLLFTCLATYAQNPQQIRIFNNYDSIPFEEGNTVIAEVTFTGYDNILLLKKALKYYKSSIESGDFFYGSKVSKAAKAIREYLATDGYYKAEIYVTGEKLPENKMKLSFSINQCEQSRVDQIRFEGNKNIPSAELVESVKHCVGKRWEIFDRRFYEYATRMCSRELMLSKGYLKAEIKNISYQSDKNGNVVEIGIIEGVRYKIGEIEIEGLTVFSREQLLEMFGQKTGDVANSKLLQNFFYEKLKDVYGNIGYVHYDAEFDPELINPKSEGDDGILNLKITIDEGKQYKVSKITIISAENAKDRLKKLLGITEGEIFNRSKFESGIKRINETKDFAFVDKDKDVEFLVTEEIGEIHLVVKVKSKWLAKYI